MLCLGIFIPDLDIEIRKQSDHLYVHSVAHTDSKGTSGSEVGSAKDYVKVDTSVKIPGVAAVEGHCPGQ